MQQKLVREGRTLGTTAGGSTYMITLPKAWVEELELKKGDELALVRVESGIYLSLARQRQEGAARIRLTVDSELKGEALARALISRYIAGYDIIEIAGSRTSDDAQLARHTVQRLIGAMILQETSEYTRIHILQDSQVLSPRQLRAHIQENVEAMFQDALDALIAGHPDKAQSVIQRDERVDGFFLLLSRQLYAALRNPLAEVEWDISRVAFFNTHTVARQLERVADHAVKIARAAEALIEEDLHIPPEIAEGLERAKGDVQALLTQVTRAYLDLNQEEAHRALKRLRTIEHAIEGIYRHVLDLDDSHLAFHLGIVVDSIGRVKDYASNIAELALNAEALP